MAVCHAVEPVAEHLPWHDCRSLAGEHKEAGLEGIFGIMVILEKSAADAPHHRAVATYDRLEDGALSPSDEAIQELSVRQPAERTHIEEGLKFTDRRIYTTVHQFTAPLTGLARPLPTYYPVGSILIHFFALRFRNLRVDHLVAVVDPSEFDSQVFPRSVNVNFWSMAWRGLPSNSAYG
jgi:hypothetical protein